MSSFGSLKQLEDYLYGFIPEKNDKKVNKDSLTGISTLMNCLDNPQKDLKIIHVAGTSGKTSTCYYIADLLMRSGCKVVLTISPHVISITERFQIDGKPVSEKLLLKYMSEFLNIIEGDNIKPTYFEILSAFSFWLFKKQNVDFAVIETGVGGLYDTTNIANKEDKICVITDIGYDHMNILGDTIEKIAGQKAGIIHQNNKVFMYDQGEEINNIFRNKANDSNAHIEFLDQKELSHIYRHNNQDISLFQIRNWLLARRVTDYISKNNKLNKLADKDIIESLNLKIPGRMEEIIYNSTKLIFDGAHNSQKMVALVSSIKSMYPSSKLNLIVSFKSSKTSKEMLESLKPITSKLIITNFDSYQKFPLESKNANFVYNEAKELGFKNIEINSKWHEILNNLNENEMYLITGSFYLVSVIQKYLYSFR